MNKTANIIVKFRYLITILIVVITVLLGYKIKDIRINSDFINSLPDDDPIAVRYKEIGEKYKGIDMGMIILETENIYEHSVLEYVRQITDSLRIISGISTVTSLTNIIDIKSDEYGIEISNLIDEYDLPETPDELKELKDRINEKDMYKGSIVSEDGTATIIMFTLFPDVNQQEVAKIVKEKINGLELPVKLSYGGAPIMLLDISDLIISDLALLIPIICIVLFIILYLCFKSFRGVILPLLTVGLATIWTMGIMVLLEYDITLITGNIPVILFAVGTAYAIHVINHVKEIRAKDNKKAVLVSLAYIITPVFLSAITTAFSFFSFTFGAYLIMIKDFGIFCSIGVLIALILTLTFVPAIQVFFPDSKRKEQKAEKEKSFIKKYILNSLHYLLLKHPKFIFSFWIVVILFGLIFSSQIKRSSNIAHYFKSNNPARISEEILQEKFGGSAPVYVIFGGDMQSPEVLNKMLEAEEFMKQNPFIINTNSVANLIRDLNDAMGEGLKIPDEKIMVEQLWFLLEGQDIMEQLVDYDKQEGVIQSRFASSNTSEIEPFLRDMQRWIDQNQTKDIIIELNGMPSINYQMDQSLLKSQLTSIGIAVILVFLLVSFVIKSAKLGLFGIIPILSTIILLFGFMGISGIPLDIATVLVASAALGIGIDYSVHIINAFNFYKTKHSDIKEIIEKILNINGKAIVINVFTVTGGFLVLLLSDLIPIQHFGLLVAISVIFSGFGALTLLPAILILNKKN